MRIRITKMILWSLTGLGATIVALRILHGPGSVTALTDALPWGIWKGWGVVALVPMGGAGFTLAMLVYVFRLDLFKPVVRGAVLLGLTCYSCVAFGLTMDIGIWWRIVFPVFHWQYHSVLFEVAWCIMLYLMVLVVEFGHTVFQRFGWRRAVGVLEKLSIFLVIFGISLSTLHQSSLGTLFLATPFRLHPLWYTDFLPILFFVSSMAIGCLTISFLTIIVYWLYGGKPPMKAISGLGRLSAYLMVAYLAIKFVEVLASGEGGLLVAGSWDTANFWIEVLLSALIPAVVLFQKRYRQSTTAVFWVSLCAIVGVSLNRVNVAGLATVTLTRSVYIPTWTEWGMTLGILSAAALVYLFCVEYFDLFDGIGRERAHEWLTPERFDQTDWKTLYFGGLRLGSLQLYSLVFIMAAAVSFGLLDDDAVFGVIPVKTPVENPRRIQAARLQPADSSFARLVVDGTGQNAANDTTLVTAMMLDGNRNGRFVLFDHRGHQDRQDGERGCTVCHHMNKPYDRTTGCHECHSDMFTAVEIFDHDFHMNKLGGNDHCADCHFDSRLPKVRENTKSCFACHTSMLSTASRVKAHTPEVESLTVGYMEAMHGLCVGCHQEAVETHPEAGVALSRCTFCHQSPPAPGDDAWKPLL